MNQSDVNHTEGASKDDGAITFGARGLQALLTVLSDAGRDVLGPTVVNGVISHGPIEAIEDLPVGWTDEQEGGHYRLVRRDDEARFGYAVGPHSWKELLHPPRSPVWTMRRDANGELDIRMHEAIAPKRALFGRPCEIAAIAKQDRVLLDGPHPDPAYAANRADVLLIAVECGTPAPTCFCPSMETGPAATTGHDIALTEVLENGDAHYVARSETAAGRAVLQALASAADDVASSTVGDLDAAAAVTTDARKRITRQLDADRVQDVLYETLDSPHWDAIAQRCLTCGNCTMACPTCFCTNLEDVTDLSGEVTDRWRTWDTCFSLDYSHLGPGPHRSSAKSRYRQWVTHKLASWIDQFDESGCVGCGRCITWCPVGIDFTAEIPTLAKGMN